MLKSEIISLIELRIKNSRGSQFQDWYIGITNDIEGSKNKNGNPKFWSNYQAENQNEALEILDHFKKKNMKVMYSSEGLGNNIYIF